MATILIEDIPAELHERLSEAASRHHRSVSEEALALLQRSLGNSRRRTELPPLLELREPLTREFLERAFPAIGEDPVRWRIPFGHHPPYSAGPLHHNTDGMEPLIELFHRSGVRAHFSGHEHNFQHSYAGGIDYFVSGAGAKIRRLTPDGFEEARTLSWSGEASLCSTMASSAPSASISRRP